MIYKWYMLKISQMMSQNQPALISKQRASSWCSCKLACFIKSHSYGSRTGDENAAVKLSGGSTDERRNRIVLYKYLYILGKYFTATVQ